MIGLVLAHNHHQLKGVQISLLRERYRIVELGDVFYLNPLPHLDPQKNQNGTMAKDALLMEKFTSAESVR